MQLNLKKTLLVMAASLVMPLFAIAQNINVSGTVTDQSGETVIGAAVMISGTNQGAVTSVDGTYSIQASPTAIFEVSCIGYKPQRVAVQGRAKVDIVLEEDTEQLEGTVVIGYGTARRQDITGSITSVGGDNLRAVPAGDVTRALEGRVAGVEMTQPTPNRAHQCRFASVDSVPFPHPTIRLSFWTACLLWAPCQTYRQAISRAWIS